MALSTDKGVSDLQGKRTLKSHLVNDRPRQTFSGSPRCPGFRLQLRKIYAFHLTMSSRHLPAQSDNDEKDNTGKKS